MQSSRYFTSGFAPELEQQIRRTRPGMAHWAGSGPPDATCGQCAFWTYWEQVRNEAGNTVKTRRRKGGGKYYALTGQNGPAVPAVIFSDQKRQRGHDR